VDRHHTTASTHRRRYPAADVALWAGSAAPRCASAPTAPGENGVDISEIIGHTPAAALAFFF
jgi:hypothetical protein